MDYIPQFGQAVGTQDVSGMPVDESMAQLQLKRKLAQAEALRNAQIPEGQMVSGRFVAPSWTQYLASALGKIQGAQQERKAMEEYGQFQKGRQQKMAEALEQLNKDLQGKRTVTEGSFQVQRPTEQIPTSPFGTMQENAPTSPFGTGGQPQAPINVPMTTTTMTAPTTQDRYSALMRYGAAINNPEMIARAVASNIDALNRQEEVASERAFKKEETAAERAWREKQTANEQEFQRIQQKDRQGFELTQDEKRFQQQWKMQKDRQGFESGENAKSRANQLKIHELSSKAAPSGYKYAPDGSLTFIPGGPADPNTRPLNVDQANARVYGRRLQHSHEIASGFEDDLNKQGGKLKYDPIATRAIVTGPKGISDLTYGMASKETQSAATAMRDFINATLRRESGAAISASEYDSAIQNYFPQPGEDASVTAQKRKNREIVIEGMREAGGYPRGQSQQPAQRTVVRTGTDKTTGRKVVQYSDGTTAYAD